MVAVVLIRVPQVSNTLRLQIIVVQALAVTQPVVALLLLLVVLLSSRTLLNLHSRQVERRIRLLQKLLLPACWLALNSCHLLVSLLNLLVVVQLVLLVITPELFVSTMQLHTRSR